MFCSFLFRRLNQFIHKHIDVTFILFFLPFSSFYFTIENTVCDKGWYGVQCREPCGHCQDSNQCLQSNGRCLTGCMAGYSGHLCKAREHMTYITILFNM